MPQETQQPMVIEDTVLQLLQSDSGARAPKGKMALVLLILPLCWSLFQLWYASPFGLIGSNLARPIHLAFATSLAFLAYPAFNRSPQDYIPWQDWIFAILAAGSCLYLVFFDAELALRPGNAAFQDLVCAGIGMLLLLEATRRSLGPPLLVVASVFLLYTLFGPYFPEVIAHHGATVKKLLTHQWLTSEGVFGVAIGVSVSFVFLFVLFGALLEKAGAGNYFIQVAFSLLGHMRGGPAKAAVVASGLSGLVSGSSIANVVTTGTFTIPLMKKVGFSPSKAAAVEVAASTNGQVTPPIMGAAAFLMVEYIGIPYLDVIKYAALPALISYIALFYMVHLEACKANMQGLPRRDDSPSLLQRLWVMLTVFLGLCLITLVVYYGIGWLREVLGPASLVIIFFLLILSYIFLLWYACRFPELKVSQIETLPPVGPTVKAGLYFLLPVVVLVWCLTVERLSPGASAFWATLFMICIVLTQRPLIRLFRKQGSWKQGVFESFHDLIDGLITGARNMIGIGVATAAAGIVVGTVTLTGIGLVMTELVEFLSGGNLLLILLFTAIISLILGMGLPTTANYIVVSSLMAPVIVSLGAAQGLIVPLVAVHLFVFYFGIMADVTPPVGLASFAAAAISRSDPIKTGVQGFIYNIRTAILPFMFIFNTNLLLIGIDSTFHLVTVIVGATAAMLVFAAATQGWWLTRNRIWETLAMLAIAFFLFRPDFLWDKIYPPLLSRPAAEIVSAAESVPGNGELRVAFAGEDLSGKMVKKTVMLPLGAAGTGQERLRQAGLNLLVNGQDVEVEFVEYGSPAQSLGIDFGWKITAVEMESKRPPKEWVMLPAFGLLSLIAFVQLRRRRRQQETILQK